MYGPSSTSGGREEPGFSRNPRDDTRYVEGKIFLGGLSGDSTKETVEAYCQQW